MHLILCTSTLRALSLTKPAAGHVVLLVTATASSDCLQLDQVRPVTWHVTVAFLPQTHLDWGDCLLVEHSLRFGFQTKMLSVV
jgi:hypothetical protein